MHWDGGVYELPDPFSQVYGSSFLDARKGMVGRRISFHIEISCALATTHVHESSNDSFLGLDL